MALERGQGLPPLPTGGDICPEKEGIVKEAAGEGGAGRPPPPVPGSWILFLDR